MEIIIKILFPNRNKLTSSICISNLHIIHIIIEIKLNRKNKEVFENREKKLTKDVLLQCLKESITSSINKKIIFFIFFFL